MKKLLMTGIVLLALGSQAASANEGTHPLKRMPWSFEGMTGSFDRQSIQRGYQVYKEVCSACHALKRVAYRNLEEIGFSPEEVKAIAAEASISDGPNNEGEMFERPGRPSDYFPSPFPNEQAARASNGGAYPPDLSLIIKARPDGANYLYSLLTGYEAPPADVKMNEAAHYNPYFPGGQLMMPPPLTDGQVSYQDGTQANVDQMARDVVQFLQWAAEPEMEHRKRMGIKVLLYLGVFTGFFYLAKKRLWSHVK